MGLKGGGGGEEGICVVSSKFGITLGMHIKLTKNKQTKTKIVNKEKKRRPFTVVIANNPVSCFL